MRPLISDRTGEGGRATLEGVTTEGGGGKLRATVERDTDPDGEGGRGAGFWALFRTTVGAVPVAVGDDSSESSL